jgi:hypothetical protein
MTNDGAGHRGIATAGVGIALSPVAIIAVVLMLTTERARTNGLRPSVGAHRWLGPPACSLCTIHAVASA